MKSAASRSRWLGVLALLLLGLLINPLLAATATLYATRFEASEGFSTNAFLVGQNGWVSSGSGGNGIVANYIGGLGQQGYIGVYPPDTGDTSFSVYKPVNFAPSNASLVHFSAEMSVIDSSTTNRDVFCWTAYNQSGAVLFAVRFYNDDLSIAYELDNGNIYDTAWGFENGSSTNGVYTFDITMSFSSNRWSAFLKGVQIVTNQLITTKGAALNLADVDAEWLLLNTSKPGDNYLLFDNYTVTAEPLPQVIPTLRAPVDAGSGQRSVRVNGKNNVAYAVEASTNLVNWTALKTNVANSSGFFDYTDPGAASLNRRFYRARWVP